MILAPCKSCGKIGWHRNYIRNKNYERVEGFASRFYRNRIDGPYECLKHRHRGPKKNHPKRMKKKSFSKGKKQK